MNLKAGFKENLPSRKRQDWFLYVHTSRHTVPMLEYFTIHILVAPVMSWLVWLPV